MNWTIEERRANGGLRIVLVWMLPAVIFAMQFARGMNRHSDPDEFQFVAPPALLTQFHMLPYVDYPYFHTPNLVFVQALLTNWTVHKLLAARILSAVCGSATILILFHLGWNLLVEVPTKTRFILVGGIALLFTTCRLFTYTSGNAWNHDTAMLLTLIAFVLQTRGMRHGRMWMIIAAGFAIGFAVGIRLSFAFAVVPLAFSTYFGASPLGKRNRLIAVAGAAIAAALANLPSIWLAVLAPRQFVFGNIGYSQLSTAYYNSMPDPHAMTFLAKMGSTLSKFVTDPCNLAILVFFAVGTATRFSSRYRSSTVSDPTLRAEFKLSLRLILFLWFGAMGPTPMMQQYNYMIVPFMVLVIFYAIRLMVQEPAMLRRITVVIASTAIVLGSTGLVRWYWSVIYLPFPDHWQPVVQHREANWIRSMTRPGARILTMESEIPLEAGLQIYPEYATGRFVLLVSKFAQPALRKEFDLAGCEELEGLLTKLPPDAVLARSDHGPDKAFVDYAKAHRFRPVAESDGHSILWVAQR